MGEERRVLEECPCCGFTNIECEKYTQGWGENKVEHWLCDLCAGTFAGSSIEHPRSYDGPTLKSMCFIGNTILKAIKEQGNE